MIRGSSVSRVSSAQIKSYEIAGTCVSTWLYYRELEAFTKFGSDLDAATQAKLNRGHWDCRSLASRCQLKAEVVILYVFDPWFLRQCAW